MKLLGLIAAFCIASALVACGGGDSSAETSKTEAAATGASGSQAGDDSGNQDAAAEKPSVQPPSGPPPKELVVEDVEEGTGPAAGPGDELTVRFVAVNQDGEEVYDTWSGEKPFSFKLGSGKFGTGWDEGMTGVKAGGRRELSIPADQAYQEERALYYVVDVLEVKPAGSTAGGGQGGGANPAR